MSNEPEVESSIYLCVCLNDNVNLVKMAENYVRNISTMGVSESLSSPITMG